ncbi:MAG: hypothetical protein RLN62_04065 [Rickettsiales bacterium]
MSKIDELQEVVNKGNEKEFLQKIDSVDSKEVINLKDVPPSWLASTDLDAETRAAENISALINHEECWRKPKKKHEIGESVANPLAHMHDSEPQKEKHTENSLIKSAAKGFGDMLRGFGMKKPEETRIENPLRTAQKKSEKESGRKR